MDTRSRKPPSWEGVERRVRSTIESYARRVFSRRDVVTIDVDDVVQECMILLLKKYSDDLDPTKPRFLSARTITRTCHLVLKAEIRRQRRGLRSRRRVVAIDVIDAEPQCPCAGPQLHSILNEDRRLVAVALGTMPRRDCLLLTVVYFDEISVTELAKLIGAERGRLYKAVERATILLAKAIRSILRTECRKRGEDSRNTREGSRRERRTKNEERRTKNEERRTTNEERRRAPAMIAACDPLSPTIETERSCASPQPFD